MQRLLIVILLNLVFYFKTLSYGYVSDDCDVPRDKPKGRIKQLITQIRGKALFNAPVEHLINLVIHTTVCSLIYISFGMTEQSFWGAMLFSISPSSLMGGVHISSKHYALSTAMLLLGYKLVFLYPILYILTIFIGFNAALNPMIFWGTPYWWMILAIPVWAYYAIRNTPKGWMAEKMDKNHASETMRKMDYKKLIIGLKTLCYYTCFCLLPLRRGMYHDFLYTYGLRKEDNAPWLVLDKWFWGGLLIFITFTTNILFNPSPMSTGLMWYLAGIIFWCNFLPSIQQPVAERYNYLANVGIMYALSCLILSIPDQIIRTYVLSTVFTAYLVRSYIELPSFKDNQKFLDYNVSEFNFPRQYFAWTIKGEYELFILQDWAKGLDSFRNAFISRKVCSRINFRLAYILHALGRYEEALYHFDIAYANPMEGFEDTRDNIVITTMRQKILEGIERQKNAIKQAGESNRPASEGQSLSGNPGQG